MDELVEQIRELEEELAETQINYNEIQQDLDDRDATIEEQQEELIKLEEALVFYRELEPLLLNLHNTYVTSELDQKELTLVIDKLKEKYND